MLVSGVVFAIFPISSARAGDGEQGETEYFFVHC